MTGQPAIDRETAQAQIDGFARYRDERQRFWDEFAQTLDRWEWIRGYYQARLASVYRFLIPPGMRVLELGCGNGGMLKLLQEYSPGGKVVGMDLFAEGLRNVRWRPMATCSSRNPAPVS